MSRILIRLIASMLLVVLAACGNKGDLVKPQPDAPPKATTPAH